MTNIWSGASLDKKKPSDTASSSLANPTVLRGHTLLWKTRMSACFPVKTEKNYRLSYIEYKLYVDNFDGSGYIQ